MGQTREAQSETRISGGGLILAPRKRDWSKHTRMLAAKCQARRLALIEKLGGRCVWPGGCKETRPGYLEFDHIASRGWVANRLSRWQRIARYEREAEEGKIQLLCRAHNKMKGEPELAA